MDESVLSGTIIYTDVDADRIHSPESDFYKKLIYNLLQEKDLTELIDYGYRLLGNPPQLIVGPTLVAAPPNCQFASSSFLDMLRMNAPECHEVMYLLTMDEYMKKAEESKTPILLDCKHLGIRLITCNIRNGNETVAVLMLPESEQPFGKNDIIYMHLLAGFISDEISRTGVSGSIGDIMFNAHFKALLERQSFEEHDIRWLNLLLSGEKCSWMRICVLEGAGVHSNQILTDLNRRLYFCKAVEYNQYLVILGIVDKKAQDSMFIREIEELARQYQLRCGISGCFEDPSSILRFYRQAVCTVEAGEALFPEQPIHLYHDMKIETVLFDAAHCIGLPKYQYTSLNYLAEDDVKNETSLYPTLQTYLQYGADKTAVSKQLGIHRNTLGFRLHYIEKVLGIELDKNDGLYRLMFYDKLAEVSRLSTQGGVKYDGI